MQAPSQPRSLHDTGNTTTVGARELVSLDSQSPALQAWPLQARLVQRAVCLVHDTSRKRLQVRNPFCDIDSRRLSWSRDRRMMRDIRDSVALRPAEIQGSISVTRTVD